MWQAAIATVLEFSEGIDLVEFILSGQVGVFYDGYYRYM